MNAVVIRGDWVGRVIDGRFSLLAWLGGSGSSGIFLTESDGQKAAIKLMPASPQAEDRLATWKSTAKLSNPHLARILAFGDGDVDGTAVVYIVTELAEEALAQIIPERPLTPQEVRQMLGPILDALSYLHSNGFVHAHVKPANVLVIADEVKLSSDGLIAAGRRAVGLPGSDIHNAPETSTGELEPSADVWSLGVTVVEALTQQLPVRGGPSNTEPVLPAKLPEPFAAIARACLHVDPTHRCTVNDVRAMLDGKATASPPSVPAALRTPASIADEQPRSRTPAVPLIVGAILLIAMIIGLGIHSRKTHTAPVETQATQQAPAAEPDTRAPATRTSAPLASSATEDSKGEVLNRVVPEASHGASSTIHGKVGVAVRVTVDETGAVTNAEFTTHGPSAYFARLAMDSARNWKFKPPLENGRATGSTWLLQYAFRRDGTDVTPVETKP